MNQNLPAFEICDICNKERKHTHWKCDYARDVPELNTEVEQANNNIVQLKKRYRSLKNEKNKYKELNHMKDAYIKNIFNEYIKYNKTSIKIRKSNLRNRIVEAYKYYKISSKKE